MLIILILSNWTPIIGYKLIPFLYTLHIAPIMIIYSKQDPVSVLSRMDGFNIFGIFAYKIYVFHKTTIIMEVQLSFPPPSKAIASC